jgi:hypothetical protein
MLESVYYSFDITVVDVSVYCDLFVLLLHTFGLNNNE